MVALGENEFDVVMVVSAQPMVALGENEFDQKLMHQSFYKRSSRTQKYSQLMPHVKGQSGCRYIVKDGTLGQRHLEALLKTVLHVKQSSTVHNTSWSEDLRRVIGSAFKTV